MRPLKSEISAIAALLEQGAESPEALASAVIEELDRVRSERVTYTSVLRFGQKGNSFFVGIGPHSTIGQAQKTISKHPAAGMATAYAVVPVINEQGFEELVARVDAKPEPKGDWKVVREDAAAFKRGWRGRQADRKEYVK